MRPHGSGPSPASRIMRAGHTAWPGTLVGCAIAARATPSSHVRRRGCDYGTAATLVVASFLLCLVAASASPAQTALRRGSPIQPVTLVKRGDLLLGGGAAFESAVTVPLIGARGDLSRVGILELSYGVADGVLIQIRGDVHRILQLEDSGLLTPGSVSGTAVTELDEDLSDGTATGSGDFRVGILLRAFGKPEGLSVGGRFEFNVPSSDEDQGLGTNSMAARFGLLGSYGRGRVRLTGDVSVGILEAPAENFEQNDVFLYSAELLYSPLGRRPLRLFASVNGQASTRNRVPVGTEDLGQASLGADFRVGHWLFDAFGGIGYAGNSADWGFGGGIAFLFPAAASDESAREASSGPRRGAI